MFTGSEIQFHEFRPGKIKLLRYDRSFFGLFRPHNIQFGRVFESCWGYERNAVPGEGRKGGRGGKQLGKYLGE